MKAGAQAQISNSTDFLTLPKDDQIITTIGFKFDGKLLKKAMFPGEFKIIVSEVNRIAKIPMMVEGSRPVFHGGIVGDGVYTMDLQLLTTRPAESMGGKGDDQFMATGLQLNIEVHDLAAGGIVDLVKEGV